MWHVYVLHSLRDGQLYVGMTGTSPQERLARHNRGAVRSTKGRRPLRLIYTESYETAGSARAREKFFKAGAGRAELRELLGEIVAEPAKRRAGRPAKNRAAEPAKGG